MATEIVRNRRSPMVFRTVNKPTVTSMELQLKIWTGEKTDGATQPILYKLQKHTINGFCKIDVAPIVKDYIDISIADANQWFWLEIKRIRHRAPAAPEFIYTYLISKGYTYFEDGGNKVYTPNFLTDSPMIYLPEGKDLEVSVNKMISNDYTNNVEIRFITNVGEVPFELITDNTTNDKIKVAKITTTDIFEGVLINQNVANIVLAKIPITTIPCSKYTPVRLTFVNRYGVKEIFWFNGKNSESANIKGSTFERDITVEGEYLIENDPMPAFNVNGKRSIKVATGFMIEGMAEVIKQIMLSEQCWLGESGHEVAVHPTARNYTKKTVANDRLINYSMTFEYSADIITYIG